MKKLSAQFSEHRFIIIILAVAFFLRTWGVNFGLPYLYHFDEPYYVNTALYLARGEITNPFPTGLINTLLLEYAALFVFERIFGLIKTASDFELLFRQDPAIFYSLARITSALAGTLSVFIGYLFGLKLRNKLVGILVSLGIAGCFILVRDSHFAVPDIAMSSLVFLSIFLAYNYWKKRKPSDILWGAFVAGVAVAFKWTGLPVVIPLFLCLIQDIRENKLTKGKFKLTLLSSVCFIIGFFLFSPQILIRPLFFLNNMIAEQKSGSLGGFNQWQIDNLVGWLFYLKSILIGAGWGIALLGLGGAVWMVYKGFKSRVFDYLILLSFPIVYFGLMGSTRHYFIRYSVPLLAFIVLFAFLFVYEITIYRLITPSLRKPLLLILSLIVLAQPFLTSVLFDVIISQVDTRTIGKDWIESNIPEGAKIAFDWPVHSPPISSSLKTYPYSSKSYDLTIISGNGISDHPIKWYKDNEYDYLVTTSFISQLRLVDVEKNETRDEFYQQLDQELTLVANISPFKPNSLAPFNFDEIYGPFVSVFDRLRPGPEIKIYQIIR